MEDRNFIIGVLSVFALTLIAFGALSVMADMNRWYTIGFLIPGLMSGAGAYLAWVFGRRSDSRVMHVNGNRRR